MARKGDIIEHPVTGGRFTFLETAHDTGGEYSRIEARVSPRGFVADPRVHPFIEEIFEIRAGTWAFVVDGEENLSEPARGVPHPFRQQMAKVERGEAV